MKLPSLVASVILSTLGSAFAVTDADITPAALKGKTLTFTIANGGAPYATTGTWSGTFAASGNAFTAARITGDFVNISTTYTAGTDAGFTNISLAKIVEGQQPATLTLYTASGVGRYEVFIQGVFGVSLNGTFVIGAAAATPEINVTEPSGKLTDGTSKSKFGTVRIGSSASKIFTVKNSGSGKLTGLAVSKSGTNKSEFRVYPIGRTSLTKGGTTTFKVLFKPASKGVKRAALHIDSNDANESPFDISVTGEGAN